MLATFVFDVSEQQARVVVTVAQLTAVRAEATADQVQTIGVFNVGGVLGREKL